MLFKHKHLLEELRKNGRRAQAEIISMKTVGEGSSMRAMWAPDDDLTAGWMDCSMHLRVMPKNEAPFEAHVLTRIQTLKWQGGSVPVWYDPQDHSKVVVDYEADVEAAMYWLGDAERLAHRHDQRLGLAWTPLAGDLLPFEVMVKPGKHRVSIKNHQLDKALRDAAQVAVAAVSGHVASLAPEVPADWFARNEIQIDEPYGPLPKLAQQDCGSAALALAAAIASLLTGRLVRSEVALAGGLTPEGRLLPVDGLKEKAHIAKQSRATSLVIPAGGEHLPESQHRGLELVTVATMNAAFEAALTRRAIKGYISPR
jgi:hypothetical protein